MLEKICAAISALALLLVLCLIAYHEYSVEKVQMVVQLKENVDPFLAIKTLVPNDSAVTAVQKTDAVKNEYRLIVTTHKKQHLLDWVRSSSRVIRAEIEDQNK